MEKMKMSMGKTIEIGKKYLTLGEILRASRHLANVVEIAALRNGKKLIVCDVYPNDGRLIVVVTDTGAYSENMENLRTRTLWMAMDVEPLIALVIGGKSVGECKVVGADVRADMDSHSSKLMLSIEDVQSLVH